MSERASHRPAAVELLDTLYPVGVSSAPPESRQRLQRFTAIPSVRSARLLVSARSARASASAIKRQLAGQRRRTRLARGVVSTAARVGALRWLPGATLVVVPTQGADFTDALAKRLGRRDVHLTLPIGPRRANRKPIIQVSDDHGIALAFVKVGHNALTGRLVEAESAALTRLASWSRPSIVVPERMFTFEWHGCQVLGISPLDLPESRLTGAPARARLIEIVHEISASAGRPTKQGWVGHPLRRRLADSFDAMGAEGDEYAKALARLDGGMLLATGAWHGDFNSGNFALTSGACPVWDWERYEPVGVPVGFDLLHHDLHQWITVDRMPPRAAADRLVATAPTVLAGVAPREQSTVLARAYLLTLADRYLRDDQQTAGGALGAVCDWLLPALTHDHETGATA